MKTDIDIKDDIYMLLKDSLLVQSVSGRLSKTLRPAGSTKEDVVISVLANQGGQIQNAYVNINVYVADQQRGTQYEEHSARLRELCRLSSLILGRGHGHGFRYELESQRVIAVPGTNEHMINNKVLYQCCNT